MEMRILVSDGDGGADEVADAPEVGPIDGWVWIDVLAADDDIAELMRFTQRFNLDQIAVRDAIDDFDMPKIDDFGHHLLVVLHGLRDDRVATYEVDCFLTDKHLITIRNAYSPALVALWTQVQKRPELARVAVDELTALLADV